MKYSIACLLLLISGMAFGQNLPVTPAIPTRVNEQMRYNSDSRLFYMWNPSKDAYDLKDTEFETSVIDIREINTHNNGYIILALTDDGKTRLYHGSIISYATDQEGNATWVMRSKNARGKLVFNPSKKIFTYSYESNDERYMKIFVFNILIGDGDK